jgi:hypothetical protein
MRRHAGPQPRAPLLRPTPALALAGALLCAAGCLEKLESLELPIDLPGANAPSSSAAAAPRRPTSPAAAAAPRKAAPPLRLDCDELPSAAEEQLARLPPQPGLGKAVPAEPWSTPPYDVLPGVTLADKVAARLEQIDRAFARRTREHLVVTSGTRDANRQARAMYTRLKLGADLLRLYRNKAAVQEIKQAYQAGAGKPPEAIVAAMQAVLQGQIDRGVFVSAHLRAGAVDIRNRTMTAAQKRAFVDSAAEVGGVLVLEESKPAHYHLQFD